MVKSPVSPTTPRSGFNISGAVIPNGATIFGGGIRKGLKRHFQDKYGIVIDFVADEHIKPLDDDISANLFKSIQELLFNTIKHANAHNITLSIKSEDNFIKVEINDDGIGFNPHDAFSLKTKTGGFGLFSIRERLAYLGGHLRIKSKPGYGTKIIMVAPLKSRRRKYRGGMI